MKFASGRLIINGHWLLDEVHQGRRFSWWPTCTFRRLSGKESDLWASSKQTKHLHKNLCFFWLLQIRSKVTFDFFHQLSGATAAQSSTLASLDAALGITHDPIQGIRWCTIQGLWCEVLGLHVKMNEDGRCLHNIKERKYASVRWRAICLRVETWICVMTIAKIEPTDLTSNVRSFSTKTDSHIFTKAALTSSHIKT